MTLQVHCHLCSRTRKLEEGESSDQTQDVLDCQLMFTQCFTLCPLGSFMLIFALTNTLIGNIVTRIPAVSNNLFHVLSGLILVQTNCIRY